MLLYTTLLSCHVCTAGRCPSTLLAALHVPKDNAHLRVVATRILMLTYLSSRRLACHSKLSSPRLLFSTCESLNVKSQLLQDTDVFIFDCDGVIWRGNEAISGATDVITKLRNLGKKVYFITNNSTKSRRALQQKFSRLGFEVTYDEVLSSSYAAATYLKQHGMDGENGGKAYVLGEEGICEELALQGIPYLGGPQDSNKIIDIEKDVHVDIDVKAVVAGLDRGINYYKLQYAQICLSNPEVLFIATNEDARAHLTPTQQWAGGGAIVGALKGCSGRNPLVVGKPSDFLIRDVISRSGSNPQRMCMVGDRLDTDILFGLNNGLQTLLVLSGVTTEDYLHRSSAISKPRYYSESIADLLRLV